MSGLFRQLIFHPDRTIFGFLLSRYPQTFQQLAQSWKESGRYTFSGGGQSIRKSQLGTKKWRFQARKLWLRLELKPVGCQSVFPDFL